MWHLPVYISSGCQFRKELTVREIAYVEMFGQDFSDNAQITGLSRFLPFAAC